MGFFDTLGRNTGNTESKTEYAARVGDNYEAAEKYLDHFEEMLLHADLDALNIMLANRRYEVNLDRRNDYDRKRRLEHRIGELRQERWHHTEEERRAFEAWLEAAGQDELKDGYSSGKYIIRFDSKGDPERKARLENRLKTLSNEHVERVREETYANSAEGMRRIYSDYLDDTEKNISRSYDVLRDFETEIGHLADIQLETVNEHFQTDVDRLLEQSSDRFYETLSDYLWQVNKQKAIAGRSVMILMLAGACAPENRISAINGYIEKIKSAVAERSAGDRPSEPESGSAVDIIRSRALKNEALYQYRLGLCYSLGKYVEKDEATANYWFLKAAKNGNKNAQRTVGMEYLIGRNGIAQNAQEARYWLEKAAAQGVPEAVRELNRMRAEEAAADKEELKNEILCLEESLHGLLEQIKLADHKIDYAASEREENKAVAEKQALQKRADETAAQIRALEQSVVNTEREIHILLSDDPDSPYEKFTVADDLFRAYRPTDALPLLLELSDAGCGEANALLYWLYTDGYSIGRTYYANDDAAGFYLKKGHEAGDSVCSLLYSLKADRDNAWEYLLEVCELAHGGDIYAEYALGLADIDPVSGEPDFISAVEHFKKAADAGFYRAYSSILSRYCYGNAPFEKDFAQCSDIAEQVIRYGCPYYVFDVAYMLTLIEDYGCTDEYEIEEYHKRAVELYELLTESGLPYAPANLGYMYKSGKGVPADDEKAFYYYSIAAERGDDQGQYNLAGCYETGTGTAADMDKAVKWYRAAAGKGNRNAAEALERLGIRN